MGKKSALLLSVLLFAGFFFFFVFYSGTASPLTPLESGSLAGEVRQAQKLLDSLPGTMDADEIFLCFRGEELACDRESRTWYLPVDMDNAAWEAGSFTDADEGIQVLPLQDYTLLDKQEAVAEGTRVPFLVWKEKEAVCTTIDLVFTGLPVVRIETDADLDVDTVFAGSVVFYEDCGQEDWTLSSVFQAHERGQTTRAYPKKGYRLNLISVTSTGVISKNTKPVLGMRDSDSWIFYAIYSDGTKIRDKFNIELWNQFGAVNTPYDLHFGTHMEYAELIVNGEYRGLYGILEPIDSKQLAVSDQEYLYKRTYGRELLPELFDAVPPEDYLTVLGMELKGRDGSGTKADWQCFRRFAEFTAADDLEFTEEAQKLVDLENFTDIWLYLQALYGEDNIYKNMFFTFKKESSGYRLYLVPWDVDLTWGNVYTDDAGELYAVFEPDRAEEYLEWPFADRMIRLNVGNVRDMIADRWKELRQGVFSDEYMEALMEECIHQVQDSGAFARDALRWPKSHHDGDYEGMRTFMEVRMNYLDELMQK
ncbi:MAG: CotH kinase family protein [Clostridiales bacterium]|nr:CotH kinase family protein [Clostridiales bacterium]